MNWRGGRVDAVCSHPARRAGDGWKAAEVRRSRGRAIGGVDEIVTATDEEQIRLGHTNCSTMWSG